MNKIRLTIKQSTRVQLHQMSPRDKTQLELDWQAVVEDCELWRREEIERPLEELNKQVEERNKRWQERRRLRAEKERAKQARRDRWSQWSLRGIIGRVDDWIHNLGVDVKHLCWRINRWYWDRFEFATMTVFVVTVGSLIIGLPICLFLYVILPWLASL